MDALGDGHIFQAMMQLSSSPSIIVIRCSFFTEPDLRRNERGAVAGLTWQYEIYFYFSFIFIIDAEAIARLWYLRCSYSTVNGASLLNFERILSIRILYRFHSNFTNALTIDALRSVLHLLRDRSA